MKVTEQFKAPGNPTKPAAVDTEAMATNQM
jgi:hypothetical protein